MLDSLKKTLHDRMTSPFTGSFLVSWIVVNWKFILALFSSEKYAQKVILLEGLFTPFWTEGILYFIIYPLIGACFYISGYQLIIAGSLWVWFWLERAKDWGRGNKVLTVEKSREYITEMGKLRSENKRVTAEHAESKKELDDSIIKRNEAIEKYNEINKINKNLETDYENLDNASQSEKTMLDKKNNELNNKLGEIQNLKMTNDELTKERDITIKENKKLADYEKILSDETTSLKAEVMEHKERNNDLQNQLKSQKKKSLLEIGHSRDFNSNLNKEDKKTAFYNACISGNFGTANVFLKRGFDVNTKFKNNSTVLHAACFTGEFDVVKLLLDRGIDVNAQSTNGLTALHLACLGGYPDIVKLLLKTNANINVKDKKGRSILDFVSEDSEISEIFKIDKKIKFKGKKEKEEELFSACKTGHIRIAENLIKSGVDVDASDRQGNTALHYACAYGKLRIAKMLVRNKAEMNEKNELNNTPIDYAFKYGFFELGEFLEQEGASSGSGLVIDRP